MEGSQSKRNVFEEYTWMENMEAFDREVEEKLWEEDFIRSCIEQLLEEEEERETLTAAEIFQQKQLQNFQNLQISNSVPSEQRQGPKVNGFHSHSETTNGYSNGIDILVSAWPLTNVRCCQCLNQFLMWKIVPPGR